MRKIYCLAIIALAAISVSGCTLSIGEKTVDTNVTGGLFKTMDNGVSWQQLGAVSAVDGKKLDIFALDTSVLAVDPGDPKAFYMGTFADGLFFTYDAGASWQLARSFGQKAVIDVAIDPKNKCNIYVTAVGRVFQSTDCNRSWREIYSDNNKYELIYSVVVDHFNSNNIYISNNRGDVIKSADAGQTWQILKNLGGAVRKLVMDPKDSRLMMAAVDGKGLFKTTNAGQSWQDMSEQLKDIKANKGFRDLIAAPSALGFYLLAVDKGLFQTANYGEDWTEVNLISKENRANINALAVSHFNEKMIYYLTDTTFYATLDGGQNWSSRKLPSPRQGSRILASPVKDGAVYIGVKIQ